MPNINDINGVTVANLAKLDAVLKANISKVNGLTLAAAFTGLLDTYTGAAAAYSVRRLYSLYTGAALRVREDSGDTETDIGFDSNGDLDTAAIATHCGTANGYVVTWYGQESSGSTGSGNDATQSTSADQMQIYNGSAVITENGKPALEHQDLNGGLDITGYTGSSDATILAVMADLASSGSFEPIPIISFASGVPYAFRCGSGSSDSAYRGFGTSPNSFINGVEDTSLTMGEVYTTFASAQGLAIGIGDTSGWTGSTFHLGWNDSQKFQEVIFWNSDQDTAGNITGIQNNVNTYYSIYT